MARNNAETRFTIQKILNLSLDDKVVGAIVPRITNLQWVDANSSFIKVPFMGISPRIEVEYSGDNLIYEGHNLAQGAATSAATWIITKSKYDGSGNFTGSHTLVRAWDDRADPGWAV